MIRCFLLVAAGFGMTWVAAPMLYQLVPFSHPYVTGLALVLGIWTFGVEGVLLGPLIV